MKLDQLIQTRRTICVIGIDDAHYHDKTRGSNVHFSGIVCGGTRLEGMIWNRLDKDGLDSTLRIKQAIESSKFHAQLHLVLLDGITFGGANVVDLPALSSDLGLPVVAVMRRPPNVEGFRAIFQFFPDADERLRRVEAAGPIHQIGPWVFQCAGEDSRTVASALTRLTDRGNVPEALRLAHLIGAAVQLGESGKRA
ncbi:MAG: DUF99 family protein [Planctomycetales bacterium]|nr:DUF99 family protein [Planctomycetales bacterium]